MRFSMRGIEWSPLAPRRTHTPTHACICRTCVRLDGRGYGLTILSFLLVSPLFPAPLPRRNRARSVVYSSREKWWEREKPSGSQWWRRRQRGASERRKENAATAGRAERTEDGRTSERGREKERGRVSRACLT